MRLSYLDLLDRKLVLRVGLQIVNHAVEIGGVEIFVSRIVAVMVGCVTHRVVPIIGDILKISTLVTKTFPPDLSLARVILRGFTR